jgi:hypothetical protein
MQERGLCSRNSWRTELMMSSGTAGASLQRQLQPCKEYLKCRYPNQAFSPGPPTRAGVEFPLTPQLSTSESSYPA